MGPDGECVRGNLRRFRLTDWRLPKGFRLAGSNHGLGAEIKTGEADAELSINVHEFTAGPPAISDSQIDGGRA